MSQPTIFDVIQALNILTNAVKDMTKAVNEKEMSTFEHTPHQSVRHADTITAGYRQTYPPPGEELLKEEPPKTISLAEIRGALAEKSRAGHSAEDLVRKAIGEKVKTPEIS